MQLQVLVKQLVSWKQKSFGVFALGAYICVATFLSGPLSAADKIPKSERKNSSPTMAKFYKVDGAGRSMPDKVTVPTLSNPEAEKPTVGKQAKQKPKPAKKPKSKSVKITVNRKQKQRDTQAEWQCERAGFYYTNDGRCVAPAPARRISKPVGAR
jgi:hypothetical protein